MKPTPFVTCVRHFFMNQYHGYRKKGRISNLFKSLLMFAVLGTGILVYAAYGLPNQSSTGDSQEETSKKKKEQKKTQQDSQSSEQSWEQMRKAMEKIGEMPKK